MAEWSIGEVAERMGLAASAIRYYESQGLIPRAARRNGRRVYNESILQRLALIDLVKRAGFTIAETKGLLKGFAGRTPPGARWRSLAAAKIDELDARIAEAEQMKRVLEVVTSCKCPTIDDCSRAMAAHPSSPASRHASP